MDTHFIEDLIPSAHTIWRMRLHFSNSTSKQLVAFPLFPRRAIKQMRYSCIVPLSKRSAYQDFQGFVKPSRLLPAAEANTYTGYISDEIFSSVALDNSNSLYILELRTSKEFGSCLRDLNAAIMLSLINCNGDSILQRISAVSCQHPGDESNVEFSETIHFQRGSVDIVTFKGPKLGNIQSLWMGLESGSWRLDGISLTVINSALPFSDSIEVMKSEGINITQYGFESDNVLLGEGGVSMIELRPVLVTESSSDDLSTLSFSLTSTSSMEQGQQQSNEESMREYNDLKFSLLLYDSILVLAGSSTLLAFSSDERYAYSFLVGGMVGFIYLLLLQRSVDGLSTEMDQLEDKSFVRGFGRFKGPPLGLAVVSAASVVAVQYGIIGGSSLMALTAADLFIGAAGFLACKIAVILAAFRPIKRNLEE